MKKTSTYYNWYPTCPRIIFVLNPSIFIIKIHFSATPPSRLSIHCIVTKQHENCESNKNTQGHTLDNVGDFYVSVISHPKTSFLLQLPNKSIFHKRPITLFIKKLKTFHPIQQPICRKLQFPVRFRRKNGSGK